ncbi:MAG TPA: amidohydrolase family protein, partial [Candidatus Hodarchaeales archaeon]|nr:amidohydrolase family protein [Candidatus Hodarchaeales archaeon]
MPGLVNTHTHLAMTLLRGFSDDKNLHEWLEKDIFPMETILTEEDIFLGARLGAVESALAGVTTVNTMYHSAHKEAEALKSVGLRGVVGEVCFSGEKDEDIRLTEELIQGYHGSFNGLIRVSVDPHAAYTTDLELIQSLKQLIEHYNSKFVPAKIPPLFWHMHTAETSSESQTTKNHLIAMYGEEKAKELMPGTSIFEYLSNIGMLNTNEASIPFVAAHCVSLEEKDIAILKTHDIGVASNPVSNLKLASGVAPVPRLRSENINVGIGTDSAASNNSLDCFDSLRIMALIHKGVTKDPLAISARDAVAMATSLGAKILGFQDLGAIRNGFL